jgi:hypothetical protein
VTTRIENSGTVMILSSISIYCPTSDHTPLLSISHIIP